MTDKELIRRALMGSREAQQTCTDKGIMLPCPFCQGEAIVEYDVAAPFEYDVVCGDCGIMKGISEDKNVAIREWNTRPAPPVGRCGECKAKEEAVVNDKGFLVCPASGMEITDNDFYSYFEPKEEQ